MIVTAFQELYRNKTSDIVTACFRNCIVTRLGNMLEMPLRPTGAHRHTPERHWSEIGFFRTQILGNHLSFIQLGFLKNLEYRKKESQKKTVENKKTGSWFQKLRNIANSLQKWPFPVWDLFTVLSIFPPSYPGVRAVCLSALGTQLSRPLLCHVPPSSFSIVVQLRCNYNRARTDNLGETLVEKFDNFSRIPLSPPHGNFQLRLSTVSSRKFGKLEQNIQFHIFPSWILHSISKYGMTRNFIRPAPGEIH